MQTYGEAEPGGNIDEDDPSMSLTSLIDVP
jgi:hypothetical protein